MAWIKVYPDLLQDQDFLMMNDNQKALLLELWCLASERSGYLKDINSIAFRTRRDPMQIEKVLNSLNDWIDFDAVDTEDKVTKIEPKKKVKW